MSHNLDPFEPGGYYHIYNQAVGKDKLFIYDFNYDFFLQQYQKYISGIANTLAYCLIPNHFHFVIQIKEPDEINTYNSKIDFQSFLCRQFSNFFNSYAKAINKHEKRSGSLFKNRFKRKRIERNIYLKQVIQYVHLNPVHHKLTNDFRNWPYSSYEAILADNTTTIEKEKLLSLFHDKENFDYCHQEYGKSLKWKDRLED